jgi:DNA-binding NarL/FixJ family response regulator
LNNQRVILAHETRFLRSTLKRLIAKSPELEVVAEVDRLEDLPAVLLATPANWLILSLPENSRLPAAILDALHRLPTLRVLAVSGDGSRMRVEWVERHDHETGQLSVQEFMALFSAPEHFPAHHPSAR